ncbi:MAG: sucrase ferredoxin [Actinomycetota bacterium]|nr:sucrase ferredoxin [Actinomycetota bacterium]
MAGEAVRCADAADARLEPLYGTASFVRSWLLIEQPGSWGSDALTQSKMPQRAALELRRRARSAGVRIVLIRRGVRFSSDRRRCYFLRTDELDPYRSHLEVDRVDDLLDVDLTPLGQGGPIPEAMERPDPVFLVCTHGRHDACCSIRGNQVSRVACAVPGMDAWESSHIGGDRFAANLVCFPHGVYYGRVSPGDVVALMEGYAGGKLSLDHYRGRCCYRFAVQAAEYFARRETGTVAVEAVRLTEVSVASERLAAAFSLAGGSRVAVEIRVTRSGEYRLTCDATRRHPVPRYDLISCTVDSEPRETGGGT